ncbi:hypothetical protein Q8A73_005787 [Channa argus]|nr:hypothetical protein Q8A73_005787 [Channa argus]
MSAAFVVVVVGSEDGGDELQNLKWSKRRCRKKVQYDSRSILKSLYGGAVNHRIQALLMSVVASETGPVFNIDIELDQITADEDMPSRLPPKCLALSGLFVIQQQDLAGRLVGMESTSQGECVNMGLQGMGPGLRELKNNSLSLLPQGLEKVRSLPLTEGQVSSILPLPVYPLCNHYENKGFSHAGYKAVDMEGMTRVSVESEDAKDLLPGYITVVVSKVKVTDRI